MINMAGNLHGVDRQFDVHVPFDFATAGLVNEFFGRLGDDTVTIVVEPIDQRPDRRILLVFDHSRIIECAQKIAPRLEFAEQTLVIDIEIQGILLSRKGSRHR